MWPLWLSFLVSLHLQLRGICDSFQIVAHCLGTRGGYQSWDPPLLLCLSCFPRSILTQLLWIPYEFIENFFNKKHYWVTVNIHYLSKSRGWKGHCWRYSRQMLVERWHIVGVLWELKLAWFHKVQMRYKDVSRFFFWYDFDEFSNLRDIGASRLLKTLILQIFSEGTPHFPVYSHLFFHILIFLHYCFSISGMHDAHFE
jgi:hypothetical protein